VIRIFGLFTLAQLHHGHFWDSLSRQLQRRGPDYIDRCTFRNKPLSVGDNVILPAQFPPLPYQVEDIPQDELFIKASEDEMKDVSETTTVSKDNDRVRVQ
jgi:hypothetical protein